VEVIVKSLLELRDTWVKYGKVEAVRGINFSLETGEIIALIGANGAGKSTILKAIIRLEPLARGEIIFDGENIAGKQTPDMVRRGVLLCPEGRRIFARLSVMKNLLVGAYLNKDKAEIKRNLEEIFQAFPILRERSAQAGGSLSGGEQQMLAIGRALMARPRLLMLDEPSLGLAPIVVQEVGLIVKSIFKRGVSIILAEQNALWALEVAEQGCVVENGKIVFRGTYDELTKNDLIREAYLGD
jgi:branched-chain amino acid transport system ATP-binding protein